ncbi:hypothetical protein [Photobacterium sp. R1]
MLNTSLTLSTLTLCFIGCESEIDLVKKSNFNYINSYNEVVTYNHSFTISQAFEHRKSCKDIKWITFEGSRGRKIVQYECQLKSIDSIIYEWLYDSQETEIKNLTKEHNELATTINKYQGVNEKLKEIKESSDNIADYIMSTGKLRSQADTYNRAKKKMDSKFPNGLEERLSGIKDKYANSILPSQINEVYQWTISDKNEPVFVYNGYTIKLNDNREVECNNDLLYSLENIYEDKDSKFYLSLINTLKHWTTSINFGNKGIIHLNDLKCNYS